MKVLLTSLLLAASVSLAVAQTTAPTPPPTPPSQGGDAFAPITISKETYQSMVAYLSDLPFRYANPFLTLLQRLEEKAISDRADAQKAALDKEKTEREKSSKPLDNKGPAQTPVPVH